VTTVPESLSDPVALLGSWRLARVIDDRLLGQESRVDGELSLSAVSPDRIRWEERGQWHHADGDVAVHRTLWLVSEHAGHAWGHAWWVRFEDDRAFHPWSPDAPVTHPCGADTYRGVVSGTTQQWTVEWEVTGPAKDYRMTTVLTRPCAARPRPAR
jgi:hypothetical protein